MEFNDKRISVCCFYMKKFYPCHEYLKWISKLSKKYPSISFYKLDKDTNSNTCKKYDINIFPTTLIFIGKEIKFRIQGADKYSLKYAIRQENYLLKNKKEYFHIIDEIMKIKIFRIFYHMSKNIITEIRLNGKILIDYLYKKIFSKKRYFMIQC